MFIIIWIRNLDDCIFFKENPTSNILYFISNNARRSGGLQRFVLMFKFQENGQLKKEERGEGEGAREIEEVGTCSKTQTKTHIRLPL